MEHETQSTHIDEEIRTDELAKITMGDGPERGGLWSGDVRRHRGIPRSVKWAAGGLALLFAVGFGASYFIARHAIVAAVAARAGMLQAGVEDLQSLNLGSAQKEFSSASGSSAQGIFSSIASLVSGGSGTLGAFNDLSNQLGMLTNGIGNAENDLWGMFTPASASGSRFVSDLQGIRSALGAIDADTDNLSGTASSLAGSPLLPTGMGDLISGNGQYLATKTMVHDGEKFLDAFIPWLSDASTTHHVLVLLENPSEMRPGGGFLGSYADVSLKGGSVTGIAVHDIADVDAAFTEKIVPPQPLQLEENGWRPADGNWFFDFPTTASETISLFERSGLYAASSTTFDGAIAITPQVLSDILSVTGPVTVPDAELGITPAKGASTSTTFTSDGLTEEIQAIVQAGQAKASKGTAPKSVEGILWDSVLRNLSSSTPTQQQDLLTLALGWFGDKDAMAYFKDPAIENFLVAEGLDGGEYQFPQNFNGDYLAVANTDVNSDKSERYVSSTVSLDVELGANGVATDHLVITRAHHGDRAPSADWWYRTTNQDYLQVFVPGGSALVNENGGFAKKVPPPVNYAGYTTDPLILAMQSTTKQSFIYPLVGIRTGVGQGTDPGKTVFSVWDRTYMGSSTQVVFDYTHPLYTAPADGVQYQFVIERPSGSSADYKIEVDAPLGYVFAENDTATFTYDSAADGSGSLGQTSFTLTLHKL